MVETGGAGGLSQNRLLILIEKQVELLEVIRELLERLLDATQEITNR